MILCAAVERLEGIRPCTVRGEHKITCHDHAGWAEDHRPGTCTGCLPRKADRGYLCARHYDDVETAYAKWDRFVELAKATEGRAVAPVNDGIRGSAPDGFSNLPLTFLAIDECERLLASFQYRTLQEWVSTQDGARDALLFAKAATGAYGSLEVEESSHRIPAVRCNACGTRNLMWKPTKYLGDTVDVACTNCGHVIDQDRLERFEDQQRTARTSEPCADNQHDACQSLDCRCECHHRNVSLYTVLTPFHLLHPTEMEAS